MSFDQTKFYGVGSTDDYSHENKLKTILPLSIL